VVLSNTAARAMLGSGAALEGLDVAAVSPRLADHYRDWLKLRHDPLHATVMVGSIEINASFTGVTPRLVGNDRDPVPAGDLAGALVYLEDAAETRQRAQQLKLASLGRLTASIAHEIRNPLGAISHAGQLLSESPQLSAADVRLTEIIAQHSRRMNAVVENVLALGRRETVISESFELGPWLRDFVTEVVERRSLDLEDLALRLPSEPIRVRIDRNQLHQILWNLVENALRYGRSKPLVTLTCAILPQSDRPCLDVGDTGPGMPLDVAEHVFEPFFTSETEGTGLGLYIARELAEANQALLTLHAHGQEGCCFRLSFAHPDRRQVSR
jgi:two-component system sensor histidine kinase PilS (NtrC family)